MLKKAFSVIIALILLLFSAYPRSSAYQTINYHMNTDHLLLRTYQNGVYLLNYQGGNSHIEKLAPDVMGADLRLDQSILKADVFGSTAVFLCRNNDFDQLDVYLYHIDTDYLESFSLNGVKYSERGFYFDGSALYLVSYKYRKIIDRYNTSGRLTDSYTLPYDVTQLGADYRGNIFAVSYDTLYCMNNNVFYAISGASLSVPITFGSSDLVADAAGKLFKLNDSSCEYRFRISSGGAISFCCVDGVVYSPVGSRIYGYDLGSGKQVSVFDADHPITGVFSHDGYVYALSTDGIPVVSRIRPSEFTSLIKTRGGNGSSGASSPAPNNNGGGSDSGDNNADAVISSSVYRIDFSNYYISGIAAGTTLAQFKQNMEYDGYQVTFYRGGSQKKSGQCGTAMTAVFDSPSVQYTFELSVSGDITGEGNVNSRDLSLLMEYLIGEADFNGVYRISSDLSGDGKTDVKDLALMHRMI